MEKTISESVIDAIQPHRCAVLFIAPDYEVLKTKVKNQILDTLYKWLNKMGYDYEQVITSVRIEGSSVGFQYGKDSDVDVSVITNLPDNEVNKIWTLLPNGNNVEGSTMPINYYLLRSHETDTKDTTTDIYDVLEDKWIKQTPLEEIKKNIPFSYVLEVAKFFTAGVDDRINEYEADKTELEYLKSLTEIEISKDDKAKEIARKEEEIKSDLDAIYFAHCCLKAIRHQAYGKKDGSLEGWYPVIIDIKEPEHFNDPNNSLSNRVYKTIEKLGYFEKLEKYEAERTKLRESSLKKS